MMTTIVCPCQWASLVRRLALPVAAGRVRSEWAQQGSPVAALLLASLRQFAPAGVACAGLLSLRVGPPSESESLRRGGVPSVECTSVH